MTASTLVIDNGSGSCKVGIAGDNAPRVTFPTVLGRVRRSGMFVGGGPQQTIVGVDAIQRRHFYELKYPVQHGMVSNWDDMEEIWQHIFKNEVCLDSDAVSVLHADAPLTPKADREKMAEIMFETFKSPSIYIVMQAVLALYSSSRTTGTVFDSGYAVSHVVPIDQGYPIMDSIRTLHLAGRDLNDHLNRLLTMAGHSFTRPAEIELLPDIKERHCFVALDYDKHMAKAPESFEAKYKLPDGQIVPVCRERFQCPESLFKPSLLGMNDTGIHEVTCKSIMTCDADVRKNLYANIVLSGGTTLFTGFTERMQKEIANIVGHNTKINIIAPSDRKYSTWIGGSIVASLPTFQKMFVTKDEYKEGGSAVIHRKCL